MATALAAAIARFYAEKDLEPYRAEALAAFAELKAGLNRGEIRAALPVASGWETQVWVKQGILLGFRLGQVAPFDSPPQSTYFDKDTLPTRRLRLEDQVRIPPGGTTIRDGVYLAPGVICMPPAYVNIGAYIASGTMVDSHALVGSCAQVGRNVHLSAAAQIGGVLEPVGAAPVIIEDDVLVGGNCGVYEGTRVGAGCVLGAGTILTRSMPVFDLARGEIHRAPAGGNLAIPAGAVVVPGSRAVTRGHGPAWGLSLYAPVIVKYRDQKTDQAVELEDWLR